MKFSKKIYLAAAGLTAFLLAFSVDYIKAGEGVTIPDAGQMKQFEIPANDSFTFVKEYRSIK